MSALTFHGGRVDEATRLFPDAPQPWLDLSTGINPRPYPIRVPGPADWRALPSRTGLAALEATAAAAFANEAGAIAAVPGSEIALRLLAQCGLPGPAVVVGPGYRTHLAALPGASEIPASVLDTSAPAGGTILLANPNNPDGRMIEPARLMQLARSLAADDGWLVVDEAFADAHEDASVLPLIERGDRVLVLRSFGKFYGLAGLRLGFVCGHPALVEPIRQRLGDWPVSSPAIAAGTSAYRDLAWQRDTRRWLREMAARLDGVLRRNGLAPRGASPLFRLVDTPAAPMLFERLARRGVLVRPFDHAPTWLRFGLPPDGAALERLDRALRDG